jgi:hypothetical protein
VLVSGGLDWSNRATATAGLIDPVAKTWSEVAAMAEPRAAHELTMLAGGDALATGGTPDGESPPSAGAERFTRPATAPLRSRGRVAP